MKTLTRNVVNWTKTILEKNHQTKLVVCNKATNTCDTFVNPDYKIFYDELVVSTPAGTMIYDRDDYTVNISQSR